MTLHTSPGSQRRRGDAYSIASNDRALPGHRGRQTALWAMGSKDTGKARRRDSLRRKPSDVDPERPAQPSEFSHGIAPAAEFGSDMTATRCS